MALLQHVDAIIPYSPVQSVFLRRHVSTSLFQLTLAWKQLASNARDYDFLPVYGRAGHLDWDFVYNLKNGFSDQIVCLCHPSEYALCKKMFPGRTEYIFTPLPHAEYLQFFQEANRVIIPMQSTLGFGVTREILGQTKYLARINWALQFQKPLLMPADIPKALLPDSPDSQILEFKAIEEYLKAIHS